VPVVLGREGEVRGMGVVGSTGSHAAAVWVVRSGGRGEFRRPCCGGEVLEVRN